MYTSAILGSIPGIDASSPENTPPHNILLFKIISDILSRRLHRPTVLGAKPQKKERNQRKRKETKEKGYQLRSYTLNLKPKTPNLKSQTLNPEPQTLNPEHTNPHCAPPLLSPGWDGAMPASTSFSRIFAMIISASVRVGAVSAARKWRMALSSASVISS